MLRSLAGFLALSACDAGAQQGTITEVARSIGATVFADVVQCTGNTATIDGLVSSAVFVPNNPAFTEFMDRSSIADPCDLTTEEFLNVLLYHAIPQRLTSADIGAFINNVSPDTYSGEQLVFSSNAPNVFFVNQGQVQSIDNFASGDNVLHVIDSVLITESLWGSDAINPLSTSIFWNAFDCSGLNVPRGRTLLVPVNSAWGNADPCATNDFAALRRTLSYHVINIPAFTYDLEVGPLPTQSGENVLFAVSELGPTFGDIPLLEFNALLSTDNYVVHTINGIMSYPSKLSDVTGSPGSLSILDEAIECAGLTAILDQVGPATIMAPVNSAFVAAGLAKPCEAPVEKLREILTYHVISSYPDSLYSALIMSEGSSPPTFQGSTWDITLNNGGIQVNGASVIGADVLVNPGTTQFKTPVVHVIDAVLLPPCDSYCGDNTQCDGGKCIANCPSESDCCTTGDCADVSIRNCVSSFDLFCATDWDSQCVEEAEELCNLVC